MKITYYALKSIQVADGWRGAGELIPEAADWPYLQTYITEGQIAPVLVATLPRKSQEELQRWEEDRQLVAMIEVENANA